MFGLWNRRDRQEDLRRAPVHENPTSLVEDGRDPGRPDLGLERRNYAVLQDLDCVPHGGRITIHELPKNDNDRQSSVLCQSKVLEPNFPLEHLDFTLDLLAVNINGHGILIEAFELGKPNLTNDETKGRLGGLKNELANGHP